MEPLSWYALQQVRFDSEAAYELELHQQREQHEDLALKAGDRVFLLTIEGDHPSIVVDDWTGENLLIPVKVIVDSGTDWMGRQSWVLFHRSAFRAYTVLDHIASV